MNSQSDLPDKNKSGLKFPLKIFLVVISVSLAMICVAAYSFNLGSKMSATYSPLVDAAMEIKLETTLAHLWLEEIISGDRNNKIEDVIKHIDNAIWYAKAMLEGGENPERFFVPLVNPIMRKEIETVLVKIKIFKDITEERYETIQKSGVGTSIDQKFDDIFISFQEQADLVATKLQDTIASDLKQHRYLQRILLFSFMVLTVILLSVFYKYEKHRAQDLAVISEAQDQVKVLSGFLPICASCKKIRDKKGNWHQMESYIKKHSEADFSHSICPKCEKNLYSEYL